MVLCCTCVGYCGTVWVGSRTGGWADRWTGRWAYRARARYCSDLPIPIMITSISA